MIPTRLDSATDLYTYTDYGLVLYNMKPTTWNVLYPFFQQSHKFTIDDYKIESDDMTYQELVDIYQNVYHTKYEMENGFDEEKRKEVLVKEFNDVFGVSGTTISEKLDSHYELKYSKSKNVYTLYYLESYIADKVNNVDQLLNQNVYQQKLLNLDHYPIEKEIDGIPLVDSLSLLDDNAKLERLKSNKIQSIES